MPLLLPLPVLLCPKPAMRLFSSCPRVLGSFRSSKPSLSIPQVLRSFRSMKPPYPPPPSKSRTTVREEELLAAFRKRYTSARRLTFRPPVPSATDNNAHHPTTDSDRLATKPIEGGSLCVEVQFTGPQPIEGPACLMCELLQGSLVGARPVRLERGRKRKVRGGATGVATPLVSSVAVSPRCGSEDARIGESERIGQTVWCPITHYVYARCGSFLDTLIGMQGRNVWPRSPRGDDRDSTTVRLTEQPREFETMHNSPFGENVLSASPPPITQKAQHRGAHALQSQPGLVLASTTDLVRDICARLFAIPLPHRLPVAPLQTPRVVHYGRGASERCEGGGM